MPPPEADRLIDPAFGARPDAMADARIPPVVTAIASSSATAV